MRQQLSNFAGPLCRQPRRHILEIAIRAMPVHACRLNQAHDCRSPFSAAQRPCESQFLRPSAHDLIWFSAQLFYGYGPVIEVARPRCSAFQNVIECSADCRAFGRQITLGEHPGMQHIHYRYGFFLPYSAALIQLQITDFTFDSYSIWM